MITIAMMVLFLHACMWDGMIFGKIRDFIKSEGFLYKPIYGCVVCMTPWWGSLIYWIFFHVSFLDYLLTVGAASGISVISLVLLDARDAFIKYYND